MLAEHPDILVAFEQGWDKLNTALRARWILEGTQPRRRPGMSTTKWTSWAQVIQDSLRREPLQLDEPTINLPRLHTRLADVIKNQMNDPGQLFGLPAMPPDIGSEYMMHEISRTAARSIIETEVPRLFRRLQRMIREGGIEKIRELYRYTSDAGT